MANSSYSSGASAGRPPVASAVVIGGSIAGLVSARILAEYFEQVTVLERDPLPNSDPRKGVPQGRHGHGLLGKGQEVMNRYFPGLSDELLQQGGSAVDLAYDAGWYQGGQWRLRVDTGIKVSIQSRPLLEATIRRRVAAVPNIRIVPECDVDGLQMNAARSAVTGVRIQRSTGGANTGSEVVAASLVVDAGGRGSRTPQWLEEYGYPRVEETHVKMNVGYTSRIFSRTQMPGAAWKALIIIPTLPDTRMGLLLPIEGDRWIASLVGWLGDYAPTDDEGFMEFARSLPQPTLYDAIKHAEPLTPAVTHRIPSNLWRRYERMSRFPEGLVVLGDALCSFNPTYAQGMTTSTLYASALDACLQELRGRTPGDVAGIAGKFRKRAAKIVANPWLLATGEDLRYAQTEGARPPVLPVLHKYLNRVFTAEGYDPYVVKKFMQVLHMMQPPPSLFLPPVAWRVLTAGWRYQGPGTTWPAAVPQEEGAWTSYEF